VPTEQAARTIAKMCELLPMGEATPPAECEAGALQALLELFDFEAKGHLHFESFARIVMRTKPSAW